MTIRQECSTDLQLHCYWESSCQGHDGPPASERTNIESDTLEAAVEQLGRELEERLAPFNELAEAAGRPFTTQALEHLPVADLVDHVDADTARAIVAALWPAGVAPAWWQTPLGRIVAAQLADVTPATETVKIAVAARMLGMGHTRVIQLLDTGLLNRSRSGVTLASVYQRIAYPGKPGRPGWRPTARTKR